MSAKKSSREISELDTHQIWAKVIPTEISDMLIKELAKEEKKEQKASKRKKKN